MEEDGSDRAIPYHRNLTPLAVLLGCEFMAVAWAVLFWSELTLTLLAALLFILVAVSVHLLVGRRVGEIILMPFLVGFALRVTATLVAHQAFVEPSNPYGFMFPDSIGYDQVGWSLAEHWHRGNPPRLEYQTAGYTIGFHYTVAGVYWVVGHAPLFMKMLIALLSTLLISLSYKLGALLENRRAGLWAAWMMAIWPPVILWSTQILKDIPITFLLLLSVLGWVVYARKPNLWRLVLVVVPAMPLVFLRNYMFLFWMISVGVGLLRLAIVKRKPLTIFLMIAMIGGGLWAATTYSPLRDRSADVWTMKLSAVGATQNSVFAGTIYRSPADLVRFLPFGVARFILTPLPWKVDFAYHWPEAIGSVFRYALLPFALIGLMHLSRRQKTALLPILICAVMTISLYAVAFRGGGSRHMTQLYPYFFVFAASGLPRFPHWPMSLLVLAALFLSVAFLSWSNELRLLMLLVVITYSIIMLGRTGFLRWRAHR
jgi:hypothetical protein